MRLELAKDLDRLRTEAKAKIDNAASRAIDAALGPSGVAYARKSKAEAARVYLGVGGRQQASSGDFIALKNEAAERKTTARLLALEILDNDFAQTRRIEAIDLLRIIAKANVDKCSTPAEIDEAANVDFRSI